MPRLTVRSFGEFLNLSNRGQIRILREQKYPNREPQRFQTPYYGHVLAGIRQFYKQDNNRAALVLARSRIDGITQPSRRQNNERVLDLFEKSNEVKRRLKVRKNSKTELAIGGVYLRLSPDLRAQEAGEDKLIYYNCRVSPLNPLVATHTVEIAHWVLEGNGALLPLEAIEYVDLPTGKIYRVSKRYPSMIKTAKEHIKLIETLWREL